MLSLMTRHQDMKTSLRGRGVEVFKCVFLKFLVGKSWLWERFVM